MGIQVCDYAGSESGVVESISGQSCVGLPDPTDPDNSLACSAVAYSGGYVGYITDQSCTAKDACYEAACCGGHIEGIIRSCTAIEACNQAVEDGAGSVGLIIDSCPHTSLAQVSQMKAR